jgi:hypothetical protein
MKKILTLAALAALAALPAHAWPYQDGDALLIFRESGFNDVEFDLGAVGQFLTQTNGYTTTVTNWDLGLVTSTFGADLTGVSVILLATTSSTNASPVAWLSGVDPNTTAYNVTGSQWHSQLYSTINSIGTRPLIYQAPTAGASSYSLSPTYVAAYDNIVSAGGQYTAFLPYLGGNSPFVVERVIPGSFEFWGIQPSTSTPKPADALIGTFAISAAGALTFVAGPPPSKITGITRAGGASAVAFSTEVGGNYWLTYTNQLGGPSSAWPVVGGPVSGTGSSQSLNHTGSDSNGFYRVVRTP